jgi:hypothetical protein
MGRFAMPPNAATTAVVGSVCGTGHDRYHCLTIAGTDS